MKRTPSRKELWTLLQLEHRRESARWKNLRIPTIAILLLLLLAWLLGILT